MSDKTKYLQSDRGPIIGTIEEPGESWDSYLVRKMTEEKEYKESNKK
jgi:hypothetical protein